MPPIQLWSCLYDWISLGNLVLKKGFQESPKFPPELPTKEATHGPTQRTHHAGEFSATQSCGPSRAAPWPIERPRGRLQLFDGAEHALCVDARHAIAY